jgi:hypothetical protein
VAAWPETCEKSAQDVLKTVNCEPRTATKNLVADVAWLKCFPLNVF